VLRVAPAVLACAALLAAPARGPQSPAPPRYEVYAVRFAVIPAFPVSSLIVGAEKGRTLDIAMMVWAIRDAGGRIVLVDAGFYRQKFLDRWKPAWHMSPADAIAREFGVTAQSVTDIIISHVHWDHADGADRFPRARVWIQKDEYEHYVGESGAAAASAIDADVAKMLFDLKAAGRVQLVDGDDQEILPGIRVYTGGKHTWASQYVGVNTRKGTVILASDNAYLYENLEERIPIAQTLDAASNLAAQTRMMKLAANPRLVVPGHDPLVFRRFPLIRDNSARID
jgi:glyoxylase-like metal-dependent hydrolase (beta-lactamase superfamily II)